MARELRLTYEMDQNQNPGHEREPFERQDLSPTIVIGFMIGLALMCVLVLFVVKAVYWGLDRYNDAHQPPQSPLATSTADAEARRALPRAQTHEKIEETFPQPRLEDNERGELRSVRLGEEDRLNSFGWVDEKAGVAHIPIERAMQLIAERGLPVYPQTGTAPPSPANAAREAAAKTGRPQPKPQEQKP